MAGSNREQNLSPQNPTPPRLLSIRQVVAATSLCRASIYNYVAAGTFPKPVRIGAGRVAWPEAEVNAWILSKTEAAA